MAGAVEDPGTRPSFERYSLTVLDRLEQAVPKLDVEEIWTNG